MFHSTQLPGQQPELQLVPQEGMSLISPALDKTIDEAFWGPGGRASVLGEQSGQREPAQSPAQFPVRQPVQRPVGQLVENPGQRPVQQPVHKQAQQLQISQRGQHTGQMSPQQATGQAGQHHAHGTVQTQQHQQHRGIPVMSQSQQNRAEQLRRQHQKRLQNQRNNQLAQGVQSTPAPQPVQQLSNPQVLQPVQPFMPFMPPPQMPNGQQALQPQHFSQTMNPSPQPCWGVPHQQFGGPSMSPHQTVAEQDFNQFISTPVLPPANSVQNPAQFASPPVPSPVNSFQNPAQFISPPVLPPANSVQNAVQFAPPPVFPPANPVQNPAQFVPPPAPSPALSIQNTAHFASPPALPSANSVQDLARPFQSKQQSAAALFLFRIQQYLDQPLELNIPFLIVQDMQAAIGLCPPLGTPNHDKYLRMKAIYWEPFVRFIAETKPRNLFDDLMLAYLVRCMEGPDGVDPNFIHQVVYKAYKYYYALGPEREEVKRLYGYVENLKGIGFISADMLGDYMPPLPVFSWTELGFPELESMTWDGSS
ncbi:hypothetical protein F4781DRAFT_434649 [Annulohypoxylon bovei var. microspora]|nr:hypothetical protein F4781DRAFT_434649 [Annulohypoxylon bovei var. microspora]